MRAVSREVWVVQCLTASGYCPARQEFATEGEAQLVARIHRQVREHRVSCVKRRFPDPADSTT